MIMPPFPQDYMIHWRQGCALFTPASQTWMDGWRGKAHEKPAVFSQLVFFPLH